MTTISTGTRPLRTARHGDRNAASILFLIALWFALAFSVLTLVGTLIVALAYVGNVSTPTMLITGEADYRTPISETEQYYQALKLRRIDTAMVRIPGAGHGINASHFGNAPFSIDSYLKPEDKTCPPEGTFAPNGVLKDSAGAEPGGCTRDLVHRFYQEQYQIDGGKQDRYTTGSDAVGLTQGHYATKQLPIWKYLHHKNAPKYVLADNFFQGAFGGSLAIGLHTASRPPVIDRRLPSAAALRPRSDRRHAGSACGTRSPWEDEAARADRPRASGSACRAPAAGPEAAPPTAGRRCRGAWARRTAGWRRPAPPPCPGT